MAPEDRKWNPSSVILLTLAVLCAVLPLTINQLTLAIVAAVVYALYQEYRGAPSQSRKADNLREHELKTPVASASGPRAATAAVAPRPTSSSASSGLRGATEPPLSSAQPPLEATTKSLVPQEKETLRKDCSLDNGSLSWIIDKEVDALLGTISPTPASDRMVKELARTVQQTIQPTFPEAEVVGFSTGDLTCSTSLGMCMPEVDLVVSINPDALPGQLRGRLARTGGASTAKLDARKVQKSAIRACTDRLVSASGFKFRRSAFRGQEPKITLLAPPTFTGRRVCNTEFATRAEKSNFDEAAAIPVDLSVNTSTPQCTDAVLRACRRFDPRAQALIVLVRRWARDRGICHSAKGHLSPYAWSLLAAFYLQVAPAGESPYLPPLQGVKLGSSGFAMQQASSKVAAVEFSQKTGGVDYGSSKASHRKSVATLFREFVLFYHKDFNWRSEAVSLSVGRRAAPELTVPLHIIVSSTGVPTQVGPHIQDPFEPKTNVGTSMTVEGFGRMQEELERAAQILSRSSPEPSLAELFEPWVHNNSLENEADGDMISSSHRGSEVSESSWQLEKLRQFAAE